MLGVAVPRQADQRENRRFHDRGTRAAYYLQLTALRDDTAFKRLWDTVGAACPEGVLTAK